MNTEKFTPDTIVNIVETLTGKVQPLGDASRDGDRLENLKVLCAVAESLVGTIHDIASEYEDSSLGSVQPIAKEAASFMKRGRIHYEFDPSDAVDDLEHFISQMSYDDFPEAAAIKIFEFFKEKRFINI